MRQHARACAPCDPRRRQSCPQPSSVNHNERDEALERQDRSSPSALAPERLLQFGRDRAIRSAATDLWPAPRRRNAACGKAVEEWRAVGGCQRVDPESEPPPADVAMIKRSAPTRP